MKEDLKPGLTLTRRIEVDRGRTIDFMGEDLRVYATPELIRDIEFTCRDLILPLCDEGEDSVGTRVEVDHLAATPLDMWVDITVTVTDVKGRLVTFDVSARESLDEIGRGKHTRFVVDMGQTKKRIAAKIAKAKEAG